MVALSARWQARRERGMSAEGGGPGQKKDTLLTQQVGPAAGCIRRGGGCGCDPIPVHLGARRNLFGHRMAVPIRVYVRFVSQWKARLNNSGV